MGTENHETVTETRPFSRRLAREEVNKALTDRGLPSVDDEEEMEEEEAEEIAAGNQVDVFDFCHPLVEKSEVVAYTIYKNSEFLATKPHPYSWSKLQLEFGEGHYRVVAKSLLTKRILKQQTSFVSAVPEKEEKVSVAEQVRQALPAPTDQFDQIAKMAALLKSLQPPPPAPIEDKSSGVMIQFMQTIMQMQQQSQTQMMTLVGEMQKSTAQMVEKIAQSQKESLEKIESKMSNPKEKGLDSMALIGLLQQAEKRGMDTWLKLDELAERKAAKMSGNDKEEEGEPKTALEKMAAAVLPSVVTALSQPKQAQTPPPVQRRMVRQAPQPQPVVTPARPAAPQVRPAIEVPKVTKEQAIQHLIPIVLPFLMKADGVKTDEKAVAQTQMEAAQTVKVEVAKAGITIPALLQLVPRGDIMDVATQFQLPLEAHTWLKGFYADLTKLGQPVPQPAPTSTGPRTPQPASPTSTPKPDSGIRTPEAVKPVESNREPGTGSPEPLHS